MTDINQKIDIMIKAIKNEANEKAIQIKKDARNRMEKEKNKYYNSKREELLEEYKKKEEQLEISKRLYKSRKLNSSRLEIQKERNSLLENLKENLTEEMLKLIKNKQVYNDYLKKLVLQGLIRLLEKEVSIKLRKEDVEFIKSEKDNIIKEFKEFIKKQTNKDITINITILEDSYLKDSEIGGVILTCNKNRIVFKNTLDLRLNICIGENIPDIRKILFPSK